MKRLSFLLIIQPYFFEKEVEMKVYRPSFYENGVYLENIGKLIKANKQG